VSIPITNVPIVEYPYYYRCEYCTGAAFFLKNKPDEEDVLSARDALHTDGTPIVPFESVKCDACGKGLKPSAKSVTKRPDPLGVKDEAG